MKLQVVVILFFLSGLLMHTTGQNFENGFNFNLPWDDSTTQTFLPSFPAFEITDFISTDPSGNFISGGKPVKFWGVNLTTNSCFPVKEKSPQIAGRMRKMGINLVRFHHMDNGWTGEEGTIFLRSSGGTRQLDPVALDRLHFLLFEMKKNGTYANINLHVSRTFTENDGVENADSIWNFAMGVTYFDPYLIELQKEFAQQLLTATNPYTGLTMANDPVIGMVEISNENTLYGMWKGDQLRPYGHGGNLMQRHSEMLDNRWHDFLLEKYGNDQNLEMAWSAGGSSGGENQIKDGGFESGDINTQWQIELHSTAQATVSTTDQDAYDGSFSGKVNVQQVTGTNWHIQFKQAGMTMTRDSAYVLEFYARSDRNRPVNAAIQRDVDPWTRYGGQTFQVTQSWRRYRLSITAPEQNEGNVRVTFNFMNEPGEVWFDNISLSSPQSSGLDEGESFSEKNIVRTNYSERLFYSDQRIADLAEFYLTIQRDYYIDMYSFLKNELNIVVPVTGTNALVGPADLYTQQDLDYIDDHAYWNHPRFPNEPWSPTDWFIDNESLLESETMGTISNLFGGLAMTDKPYTISEYNHPYPNRYHWEMMPVLASHASYHGADGIMFFQYHGGSNENWEEDFIPSFFSTHRNNTLMSMSPVFGYVYRNNLIEEADDRLEINFTPEFIFNLGTQDNFGRWGKFFPYDRLASAGQPISTKGFSAGDLVIPDLPVRTGPDFNTSNQIIRWNTDRRLHIVDSDKVQTITGALSENEQVALKYLQLNESSDEGVVSWISIDGRDLSESEISLLSMHSRIQNTNMGWQGNNTVGNQWGSSPTEILPLRMSLSLNSLGDSLRIFPLDESGREGSSFVISPGADGTFELVLDQNDFPTPWFGVKAFGTVTSIKDGRLGLGLKLWPNPVRDFLYVELETPNRFQHLSLIDGLGRTVILEHLSASARQLDLTGLPDGPYFLHLLTEDGHRVKKIVKKS